jgi:signal transduction histidine kinase
VTPLGATPAGAWSPGRLIHSSSVRLAALQTLLFVVVFAIAGAGALAMVRRAEYRAAHAEIEEVEDDLTDILQHRGPAGLVQKPGHRNDPGRDYRLEDPSGWRLSGGLPPPPTPAGAPPKFWITYPVRAAQSHAGGPVLALVHPEPGGLRLVIGEYLAVRARQDDGLLIGIIGLAGLVAGLGLIGGVLVGRRVQRRVDQIAAAVEAFAQGDRLARVSVPAGARSDHDRLAGAVNRMMDRENRLVEGLRQVTSAIAHDLRRPLAHHNQEIAQALAGPRTLPAYRNALLAASERVEEVLRTFQALLHIAELEAGAPGLKLESVDAGAVAARIVEAYTPAAEAGGRTIGLKVTGAGLAIQAEPRIFGQTVANLVENALTHTPPGATVTVTVDGERRRLVVEDDGPGVPEAARRRIFDRFFRLDASRSTPGNGLGLPLAAAAVQAFGGALRAEDAEPGLRLVAEFGRPEA